MSRKSKITEIEADKYRRQAIELSHALSEQAGKAGATAAALADQGKLWASSVAAPKLDRAWRDSVKATAPRVEAVAERARPAVDHARDILVDDYIPRLQKAMQDAARAASGEDSLGGKASKAGKAAQKALSKPPSSHSTAKTVGWILVGTAAAGTGYLLWRRTQPVDDPWAEEYWDDTTVTTPVPAADEAAEPDVVTPVASDALDAELAVDAAAADAGETIDESRTDK
ncbi:hypothetical protein [Georgenia wangjunii]|uniref:hypothetical protein n=1 Tax=Georgenia wangjunii TaxID=3117730 RepID=UPI002F269698